MPPKGSNLNTLIVDTLTGIPSNKLNDLEYNSNANNIKRLYYKLTKV